MGPHNLFVFSCFSRVWLFVTPWTVAYQASLSIGFSRQEYWSRLPCPIPGDLPNPGIKPTSPASPALQADSLPAQPLGKPVIIIKSILITATVFSRHLEYYFKTKLLTHLLSWQRLGTIDMQKQLPFVCLPTLDLRSCKAPDCLSQRQCYTNTELLILNYWRRKSRQISLWNRSTCSVGIFMVLDCSASSRGWSKKQSNLYRSKINNYSFLKIVRRKAFTQRQLLMWVIILCGWERVISFHYS